MSSKESSEGMHVPQPGRVTGPDRVAARSKARAAALNAAAMTRKNQQVEDKDTAEAIRKARKEAGK